MSVRVVCADGEPVPPPNRLVTLINRSTSERLLASLDAEGRFAHRIPPGAYEVQCRHGLYRYEIEDLVASREDDQRVTLNVQGARIEGRLRWPDGEPLGQHVIRIRRVEGGLDYDRDLGGSYDGEGPFVFYGRRPGKHVISVSGPGIQGMRHEFTVRQGDVRIPLELTLSRATGGK